MTETRHQYKTAGDGSSIDTRQRLAAADKQLAIAASAGDDWQTAAIEALREDLARAAPLRFERASLLGNPETARQRPSSTQTGDEL